MRSGIDVAGANTRRPSRNHHEEDPFHVSHP
jgi:hypothetical protein